MTPISSSSRGITAMAASPTDGDEPGDRALKLHGHREEAKYLATGLIERGVDMAYAYNPLPRVG
jgi:hypothetical protein